MTGYGTPGTGVDNGNEGRGAACVFVDVDKVQRPSKWGQWVNVRDFVEFMLSFTMHLSGTIA